MFFAAKHPKARGLEHGTCVDARWEVGCQPAHPQVQVEASPFDGSGRECYSFLGQRPKFPSVTSFGPQRYVFCVCFFSEKTSLFVSRILAHQLLSATHQVWETRFGAIPFFKGSPDIDVGDIDAYIHQFKIARPYVPLSLQIHRLRLWTRNCAAERALCWQASW